MTTTSTTDTVHLNFQATAAFDAPTEGEARDYLARQLEYAAKAIRSGTNKHPIFVDGERFGDWSIDIEAGLR